MKKSRNAFKHKGNNKQSQKNNKQSDNDSQEKAKKYKAQAHNGKKQAKNIKVSTKNIKEPTKLLSPPKREFELLYRQRDKLPSHQAYESIIFMKSKKVQDHKSPPRHYSKRQSEVSVEELNKIIGNLEIQLKQRQQKEECKKRLKVSLMSCRQAKKSHHSPLERMGNNTTHRENKTRRKVTGRESIEHLKSNSARLQMKRSGLSQQYHNEDQFLVLEDRFVPLKKAQFAQLTQQHRGQNTIMRPIKARIANNRSQNSQDDLKQIQKISDINGKQSAQQANETQMYSSSPIQHQLPAQVNLYDQQAMLELQAERLFQQQPAEPQEDHLSHKERDQRDVQIQIYERQDWQKMTMGQFISTRQQVANIQRAIHIKLLQKLHHNQPLNEYDHQSRLWQIEEKYQKQCRQVQRMQELFIEQIKQTEGLENKMLADKQMLKSIAQIDIDSYDRLLKESVIKEAIVGQTEEIQVSNQIPMAVNYNGCSIMEDKLPQYCIRIKQQERNSVIPIKQQEKQEIISDILKKNKDGFMPEQQRSGLSPEQQKEFYGSMPLSSPFDISFKKSIEEFKRQQEIKTAVNNRSGLQLGIYKFQTKFSKHQIDTSLPHSHQFLLSFFTHYITQHQEDFLRLINMPYGSTLIKKLKMIQHPQIDWSGLVEVDEEDDIVYGLEVVMPESALEAYHKSGDKKFVREGSMVHNRALFDCFNEYLNQFRPYHVINGAPFPWCTSQKALTFYFITDQNIEEVFQKTVMRVFKQLSCLCGILVQPNINQNQNQQGSQTQNTYKNQQQSVGLGSLQQIEQSYRNSCHSVVWETREKTLLKKQKQQIAQESIDWLNYDNSFTQLCLQLSEKVLQVLVTELLLDSCFWKLAV